jgi:hypothetical protein
VMETESEGSSGESGAFDERTAEHVRAISGFCRFHRDENRAGAIRSYISRGSGYWL